MSWADARSELVTVLRTVNELDQVLVTPPSAMSAISAGVTAFLVPPPRDSVRYAGGVTRRDYRQTVTIVAAAGAAPETAALLVDAAVEAVDAALESHVTLSGHATSLGAFSWTGAVGVEMPPQSGTVFVAMDGTARVTINTTVDRSA